MGGRGSAGGGSRAGIGEVQQWSLARVGALASGNEQGLTVAQEYRQKEILGNYSANDYERAKQAGFASPKDYQKSITDHIARHGMINAAQWYSSDRALAEGYHRYAAMRQLGLKSMKIKRAD